MSSEQCEIEGIILGLEMALQCLEEKHVESYVGGFYIFCDCQNAIDVLTRHHELTRNPGVCVKVKHLDELLKARLCMARNVKIQGHTGIDGRDCTRTVFGTAPAQNNVSSTNYFN